VFNINRFTQKRLLSYRYDTCVIMITRQGKNTQWKCKNVDRSNILSITKKTSIYDILKRSKILFQLLLDF